MKKTDIKHKELNWKNIYERSCQLMARYDEDDKFNKFEIEALLMDIIGYDESKLRKLEVRNLLRMELDTEKSNRYDVHEDGETWYVCDNENLNTDSAPTDICSFPSESQADEYCDYLNKRELK